MELSHKSCLAMVFLQSLIDNFHLDFRGLSGLAKSAGTVAVVMDLPSQSVDFCRHCRDFLWPSAARLLSSAGTTAILVALRSKIVDFCWVCHDFSGSAKLDC